MRSSADEEIQLKLIYILFRFELMNCEFRKAISSEWKFGYAEELLLLLLPFGAWFEYGFGP